MARRTETRPEVGAPPPFGPPSPWPAPPGEPRSRLGWAALAFVLVVAMGAGGWFVIGHQEAHHQPAPGTSAVVPSTSGMPSLPAPVPATTYDAFAALPSDQQAAVMGAAANRYGAVVGQAFQTLDGSLLSQVATGDELQVLQQDLQKAIKAGYPTVDHSQVTVLEVVLSPKPYNFVSVHIQATGTDQYLDPKTGQPIGTPEPSSGTSSYSFVIEAGVWKVSEHIQDPTR